MNRYLRATLSPLKSGIELVSMVAPSLYWKRFNGLAKSKGFKELFFCLSFDCDTEKDAEVVEEVDSKLRKLGILASYAVPAELLEKNAKPYASLRDQGASFLNHGYKIHTLFDKFTSEYKSVLSYDEIPKDKVKEDIQKGHEALKKFLGKAPKGFRTPHFGNFQRKKDLNFLHSELKRLGYEYSSSTSPAYSALLGPAFQNFGLWEYPVTGTASNPRRIYDSWSFFSSPARAWQKGDYLKEAERLVAIIQKENLKGFINCYADPSQVWNQEEFFEAMRLLTQHSKCIDLDSSTRLLN